MRTLRIQSQSRYKRKCCPRQGRLDGMKEATEGTAGGAVPCNRWTPCGRSQKSFVYIVKTARVGWWQELPWIWTGTTGGHGGGRERHTQTRCLRRSQWAEWVLKRAINSQSLPPGAKQGLKDRRGSNTAQAYEELPLEMLLKWFKRSQGKKHQRGDNCRKETTEVWKTESRWRGYPVGNRQTLEPSHTMGPQLWLQKGWPEWSPWRGQGGTPSCPQLAHPSNSTSSVDQTG